MKIFLLVVAITIHICDGSDDGGLASQMARVRTEFLDAVKENCRNSTSDEYQRITELTDNVTKCVQMIPTRYHIFVTPVKVLKDSFLSCFNELIEELESCLPEDSKDTPQLALDIIYSMLDFLYDNKDQLLTPEVRLFVQNCSEMLQTGKPEEEFTRCFNLSGTNSFDLRESCQEILQLEKCFVSLVDKKCFADDSVKKLIANFAEALREPCVDYGMTENPVDNLFTLLAPYAPPNINPDLM